MEKKNRNSGSKSIKENQNQRVNETKSWSCFFEKINKINKALTLKMCTNHSEESFDTIESPHPLNPSNGLALHFQSNQMFMPT